MLCPSVLLGFFALGCSEAAPAPTAAVVVVPRVVAQVIVDVDSTVMTVGSIATASVATLDAKGIPVQAGAATWSSEPPTVISVSGQGKVAAISAGLAKIVATVDGVRGERDVVIRALPSIALIDVALRSRVLTIGDTVSAESIVFDSVGNALLDRAVEWSIVGDPTAATVSAAGLVTAVAPGEATLIGTSGDVRGELDFSVAEVTTPDASVVEVSVFLRSLSLVVGDTTRASATPLDSGGRALAARATDWSVVGGPGVITVSQDGLVSAIAAGRAQVAATIDGVTGSRSVTVSDSVPVRDSVPVSDSTPAGAAIALPALPETLSFAYPRVTGRQWVVRAGGNLQAALNSAQRGDEIVIEAGARFSGNFKLPAKGGTSAAGWILVRSDKAAQLPAQGTRVTPAHAPLMPVIETPNAQPAISTAPSASGWWLSGLEVTLAQQSATNYGLVTFGEGNGQTSLDVVPRDLVLERAYVHGTPTSPVQRCVTLNSASTAVQDSYVHECHLKGFDTQAIIGWNGPGPFKIANNTLAGAGENILFGGADPAIRDLLPSDIVVRQNYIVTPAEWKGRWTKKNLFELKNAQRVLVEGNVLDGSWTDGQTGEAFVLKVSNQNGRCTWCATRDVTIRYNVIRNAGAAFAIMGQQGGSPRPVGEKLNRLLIEHNVAENINEPPYIGSGRLISMMQDVQNATIRNNTLTSDGKVTHFLNLADVPAGTNFVFERNIVTHGTYGMFSSKFGVGESSLQAFRGTVVFQNVVLIGQPKKGYSRAVFVPSLAAAQQRGAGADMARVQGWTSRVVIP